MDGKNTFFQKVIELSNCCNFVQAQISMSVAGFLVRNLGAKRKNFVTHENNFTERLSQWISAKKINQL